MSSITFAAIREQGVDFVAVLVKDSAVTFHDEANKAIAGFQMSFGRPVVLLGEHNHRWYGRRDIVNFMSHVPIDRIPWRRGTLS